MVDDRDRFPDDDTVAAPAVHPEAPGSQLADLRTRREQAIEKLYTNLKVPRIEPPVWVRYGPVDQARVDAANKQARTSKAKDAIVIANAAVLADSCLGVFEVIDGEKVSVDPNDRGGAWPTFGPRLAELLGVPAKKAAEVVRGLYLTDGDVISTAADLQEWSGYVTEQQELDEGN